MSFLKKSFSVFGTRVLMFVLGMFGSIIVTRMLGPANRGMLEILNTVPFLLVNVGSLGIGNANLYFVGKKKYPLEDIIGNSFGVVIVLGSFLFSCAMLLRYLTIDSLFNGVPLLLSVLSFLLIPFLLFQKLIQYAILGMQEIYTRNKIVIFEGTAYFVIVVFLVVFLKWSLFGVIVGTLITYFLVAMLCFVIVRKKTKLKIKLDIDMTIKGIKFGIIPFLVLVVMNMIFKSDIFLIKYFLTDNELGYYALSVSLGEKIWMLPEAIGLTLFASVAAKKQSDSAGRTPKVCRVSLCVSIIAGMFLYICIPFLLPLLYGDKFIPSILSFKILLPGISFITIYLILNGDLAGRGKAIYTLYVFSCGLILNIVLNILMIPKLGINGAAVSSTIAYSASSLVLAFVYSRKYSVQMRDLLIIKMDDITEMRDRIKIKTKSLKYFN